jgi:hypothetical protein
LEFEVDLAVDEDSEGKSASGVLVNGCALLMVLSSLVRCARQLERSGDLQKRRG